MNEVILEGKVLGIRDSEKDGYLYITVSVMHDHYVDTTNIRSESIFRVIMTDKKKIEECYALKGDRVKINGYLKTDFKQTAGGNEHKKINIYATEVTIVEEKKHFAKGC